jgi:hypothetical protein
MGNGKGKRYERRRVGKAEEEAEGGKRKWENRKELKGEEVEKGKGKREKGRNGERMGKGKGVEYCRLGKKRR